MTNRTLWTPALTALTALTVLLASPARGGDGREKSWRGLRGDAGSLIVQRIDVPDGIDRLEVTTGGGLGDSDLFVVRGRPRLGGEVYRSLSDDNDERIDVVRPAAGLWTIALRGHERFYGVTLRVRAIRDDPKIARGRWYDGDRDGDDWDRDDDRWDDRGEDLRDGSVRRGLSGRRGSQRRYRIDVGDDVQQVVVTTDGGRGDVDVFVSRDKQPTTRDHDARSTRGGTDERMVLRRPAEGVWHVLLHAFSDYQDVRLRVEIDRHGRDDRRRDDDHDGREDRRLVRPASGDVWYTGENYWVHWRDIDARDVQIQYSLDDGRTWGLGDLPRAVDSRAGRYRVGVPRQRGYLTDGARIRLVHPETGRVLALSGRFEIRAGRGGWDDDRDRRRRGADRYEPDDRQRQARYLPVNDKQQRTLHDEGDVDWIALPAGRGGRYPIRFSDVSVPLKVRVLLRRDHDDLRTRQTVEIPRGDTTYWLDARDTRIREFYLEVRAEDDDDRGRYSISIGPQRR